MSQEIFESIDPALSGIDLATTLNDFKDALMSGLSGTSRPEELLPGGAWVDTTDPTLWEYKIWTGSDDITIFSINLSTGIASVALAVEQFAIKRVSADTVGAILNLIKQRVADGGQVKSGDVVGEIRFTGRTATAGNPVVAKMIWTADEDQTDTERGGTFSIQSVPLGSATLLEYMKFYEGITEAVAPLKINSVRYASQTYTTDSNSPTTGELILNTDLALVEVAGTYDLLLRGVDSDGKTKEITIHNRRSQATTLKHEDGAAAAEDRMSLPLSADYVIQGHSSATLYYCETETRWKLKSTAEKNFFGFNLETYYRFKNTFVAPVTTNSVRVRAYKKTPAFAPETTQILDSFGNAYSWGYNTGAPLGDGTLAPKSSPVAVLGSLSFLRTWGVTSRTGETRWGLANNGRLYGWGFNANGQLGDNSVVAKSSPVAVSGSLSIVNVYARENSTYFLTTNGTLYACGINADGQLGDSSVTPRSAPVAVGGSNAFKFSKLALLSNSSNSVSAIGITPDGVMYAWGENNNGQLGDGSVSARSSPIPVLGSLVVNQVSGGGNGSNSMFAMALNQSGAAYAWGQNADGQLGLGDTFPRSSPVAVLGGLTFKELIHHYESNSSYGLDENGNLYAWGANDQGQLGVGDTASRSSPVAVLGGLTFAKVKAYRKSVYGLTTSGLLYAWGLNANGQLGANDVVSRSSPVPVNGALSFVDFWAAEGFTDFYSLFAITTEGKLYSWGQNANGTLAVGDVIPRSVPIACLGTVTADTAQQTYEAMLTVTPGQSYPVVISDAISYFGGQAVGPHIEKIEVEYL